MVVNVRALGSLKYAGSDLAYQRMVPHHVVHIDTLYLEHLGHTCLIGFVQRDGREDEVRKRDLWTERHSWYLRLCVDLSFRNGRLGGSLLR
jgi:hypothetical protein